jgi:ABC-type xylose transport system permease subunit
MPFVVGGLAIFLGFYLPKKKLPSAIAALHGLLVVSGFALILVFAPAC